MIQISEFQIKQTTNQLFWSKACHWSCATCDGEEDNDCKSCPADRTYSAGTCIRILSRETLITVCMNRMLLELCNLRHSRGYWMLNLYRPKNGVQWT